MSSGNPVQPKLEEDDPVTPTGAGISTIPDHISKLRSAARQVQQLEGLVLEGERQLLKENEDLKALLQTLGLKYTDLEKMYKEVESERLEKEAEAKKWKLECEEYKEMLTRAMEDLSKAKSDCMVLSEREKRIGERYNNLLADSEKEMMKKNQKLNDMKEKFARAEDLAVLCQKSDQYKTNRAFCFGVNPSMAEDAEATARTGGMWFNDLFRKESAERTVHTGNGSIDLIEIDDSDQAMYATRKRRLVCTMNKDVDDDARMANRKQIKNLSLPNMSNANDSLDSSCKSITYSYMDKLVFVKSTTTSKPSVFGKSEGKRFESEADMLHAINEDDELCINAVCAIYRQETHRSITSGDAIKGFCPSDAIRGRSLAKFLIDGDQQGRFRKSVKELQEHYPRLIDECRRLASNHLNQLFQMYQKEHPFFLPFLELSK